MRSRTPKVAQSAAEEDGREMTLAEVREIEGLAPLFAASMASSRQPSARALRQQRIEDRIVEAATSAVTSSSLSMLAAWSSSRSDRCRRSFLPAADRPGDRRRVERQRLLDFVKQIRTDLAPSRSSLFTKVTMGMSRSRQTSKSLRVRASMPLAASITITAASTAESVR